MQLSRAIQVLKRPTFRCFSEFREAVSKQAKAVDALPEIKQRRIFSEKLSLGKGFELPSSNRGLRASQAGLSDEDFRLALEVAFATFLFHVESRIASLVGKGFYTIGPCGEELLGAVGLALTPDDASALHYRHLSTSLARQAKGGKSWEQIFLDRARGYCISSLDPVGGGSHCLLGGDKMEFLVTSTLASQAPPAVGRALAMGLGKRFLPEEQLRFQGRPVSYVSVGDGSVNNAHFLAATNMAEYGEHRGFKCPVIFGISDNGLCISLRGYEWLDTFVKKFRMQVYRAQADDVLDIYMQSKNAFEYSRKTAKPCALIFTGITRRFGHAATDRQIAYMNAEEIASREATGPLEGLCAQAVEAGVISFAEMRNVFMEMQSKVEAAFDQASAEPKLSHRDELMERTRQPAVSVPRLRDAMEKAASPGKRDVMRKQMKAVFDEAMSVDPAVVYLGEDVRHGGYYLVTDGLADKFPERVIDFPPDETSLIGAGMGFSQAGLVPIVEIPYAKYLDCGGDMFHEAAVMNWLGAGKTSSGMIIRLQGFDRGIFGGNFHTHNALHLPPGIDVLCYSNGEDYVRGMRNAILQARAGRIVMSVDCTALLNMLHLHGKDDAWRRPYPSEGELMGFDEVRIYAAREKPNGGSLDHVTFSDIDSVFSQSSTENNIAIVTYGNGVVSALQARKQLRDNSAIPGIDVIDCPYLSDVPKGLVEALSTERYSGILFADICKHGQGPLAGHALALHSQGVLEGQRWRHVAAPRTYNPLGSTLTFLNIEDIVDGILALTK